MRGYKDYDAKGFVNKRKEDAVLGCYFIRINNANNKNLL